MARRLYKDLGFGPAQENMIPCSTPCSALARHESGKHTDELKGRLEEIVRLLNQPAAGER